MSGFPPSTWQVSWQDWSTHRPGMKTPATHVETFASEQDANARRDALKAEGKTACVTPWSAAALKRAIRK